VSGSRFSARQQYPVCWADGIRGRSCRSHDWPGARLKRPAADMALNSCVQNNCYRYVQGTS
jgi:hypothetical protein